MLPCFKSQLRFLTLACVRQLTFVTDPRPSCLGQALPSDTSLVKTLGVARNTVRQAIGVLEEDGVVQRIQGKGTYFTKKSDKETPRESGLLGLVLPEISRGLCPVLARGFDHGARAVHHQVILCNTGFSTSEQGNIILQLMDRKVAGMALVPSVSPLTPAFQIRQMKEMGIPVVFCHRRVSGIAAPLVTWDQEEVARMAGQAFLDHGHTRIAYFARNRYVHTEAHERGLLKILEKNALDLAENRVYYGASLDDTPSEREMKSQALEAMLNADKPVTAIFCNDDGEAELIHHLTTQMGLQVPDDLSLIGFGDAHERTGVFRSSLTSVAVNELDLGARAARVLHEMVTGKRSLDSDETIYKPLTLVEGNTLGWPGKELAQTGAGK